MFIAVDPGNNVGVATFRNDGTDIAKKVMSLTEFREFIRVIMQVALEDDSKEYMVTFVMEDFRLRHDKAIDQTGSDMPASRCIGAVEMVCTILEKQSHIYYQKPGDLKGALKWAGYPELARKPRSWHCPDDIAAYAHGVHRLIDLGIRKHPIFN